MLEKRELAGEIKIMRKGYNLNGYFDISLFSHHGIYIICFHLFQQYKILGIPSQVF